VLKAGLPEGRGLDLGCGDGLLTRIVLHEAGPRDLVGIDPDPSETAQAQALGIYSAVHTTGGGDVPEPDGSFDWVLSNSVLEHIPDLDPVLKEVSRLLRPGGVFIFTVPGPGFHGCLRGPLLPGASRDDYLRRVDARLAQLRYWDREQWRSRLAAHDMRIAELTDYLDCAEVRRWESISRLTAGVLYGLTAGRRQPIDIQRGLGLRKPGRRMPRGVARSLAAMLSTGLRSRSSQTTEGACYLVKAVRL
jgi:SAM-dependent methyltransferase